MPSGGNADYISSAHGIAFADIIGYPPTPVKISFSQNGGGRNSNRSSAIIRDPRGISDHQYGFSKANH